MTSSGRCLAACIKEVAGAGLGLVSFLAGVLGVTDLAELVFLGAARGIGLLARIGFLTAGAVRLGRDEPTAGPASA